MIERIQGALANEEGIDQETSYEIAFHFSEIYQDLRNFVSVLDKIDETEQSVLADEIVSFLFHVPNHIIAAATLKGIPLVDVFQVGAKIEHFTPDA